VIPSACGVVWQFIGKFGVAHIGINVCVYHDRAIHLDCGVLVSGPIEPSGEVFATATPGGLVASTFHIGAYKLLGQAHEAIHRWCRTQNLRLSGPSWEVYGHWTDEESKLRTDVYYLLDQQAGPTDS
jgi:effector-binding domain-containing protein